jgi:hypothetical protein
MPTTMPVVPELVPIPLQGQSLKRLLKRSEWDKIRQEVFEKQGHKCGICRSQAKLSCHEVWEYDDKECVQRLIRLEGICGLCHFATHIGNAQCLAAEGHLELEAVHDHACRVNNCARTKWEKEIAKAFGAWRARNLKAWTIDWCGYLDPIKLKRRNTSSSHS